MEDTLKMQLETSLLISASKVPQKPGMETSHTELMERQTLKGPEEIQPLKQSVIFNHWSPLSLS